MIILDNGKKFAYEMIGEFRSDGEWIHPDRTISTYELIFVLDGTLKISEEDKAYTVKKDGIIILEPRKRHFGTEATREHVAFYWFHFSSDTDINIKTVSGKDTSEIKMLLKKLLHLSTSGAGTQNVLDALGYTVVSECFSEEKDGIALIGEIKEYVRNNLQDATVMGAAEYVGYNSDYIGKLFKQQTGVGLKKYISLRRLDRAKDMLMTSNRSVKEIASLLGYDDENLFIKFFIYHEKVTPKAFGNKYYGTHINNK